VGRAFQETPKGPEEFAFIPTDLLVLLPAPVSAAPAPLGRPASPVERAHPLPANDRLLDHACTLLAALRSGIELARFTNQDLPADTYPLSPAPLKLLLSTAGLLDERPAPARADPPFSSKRAPSGPWLNWRAAG
jgi:hypothetical protein